MDRSDRPAAAAAVTATAAVASAFLLPLLSMGSRAILREQVLAMTGERCGRKRRRTGTSADPSEPPEHWPSPSSQSDSDSSLDATTGPDDAPRGAPIPVPAPHVPLCDVVYAVLVRRARTRGCHALFAPEALRAAARFVPYGPRVIAAEYAVNVYHRRLMRNLFIVDAYRTTVHMEHAAFAGMVYDAAHTAFATLARSRHARICVANHPPLAALLVYANSVPGHPAAADVLSTYLTNADKTRLRALLEVPQLRAALGPQHLRAARDAGTAGYAYLCGLPELKEHHACLTPPRRRPRPLVLAPPRQSP